MTFDLALTDGHVTGTAVVKQTDWGMKPFTALFGALKVADDVRVEIDAALPRRGRRSARRGRPRRPGGSGPVPCA